LKIVHENNAFAVLLQLCHDGLPDLLRLAHLEVERIEVSREDRDVALAR
jgi:hypothetical protein